MNGLANIRKPRKGESQKENPSNTGGKNRKPKGKRKVSVSTIVVTIILILGLAIIAYPTFSDWWNSYHQSRAIATYVQAVEGIDPATKEQMLKDARAYNKRLRKNSNRYVMNQEQKAEYESLLDPTGSGLMGYIQIPSIGVNLPIYHGVEETHLQTAIGHIEGTSLPVGGASTHCAVSGHRGLPSARLFTDLDKIVEGDIFMVSVLGETLTYEVDQIRIVLPEDMSDLDIEKGADYMTLITCTPYGINTHRILVRGHRIENPEDRATIPADAVQIPNYIAVPAVGIPMLFVYLVGALIYYRKRDKGLDEKKALETVRRYAEQMEAKGESASEDADTIDQNEGEGLE